MEITKDHHCSSSTTTLSDVLHFLANAGPSTNNIAHQYLPAEVRQPSDGKVSVMKMMMAMMDSSSSVLPLNYVSSGGGDEMMEICCVDDGRISNMRWPRQETLALLEIRSCLDPKFKEATHKAPLWAEISRIMAEEHGYQRSGKKCKEKFENLYKYYKKTKASKVGRSEGKNYRFFRQLEALYGETSDPAISASNNLQFTQTTSNNNVNIFNEKPNDQLTSTSLNSSELETSSSECQQNGHIVDAFMEIDNETRMTMKQNDISGRRRKKRKWKLKASEFIASEMNRAFEIQEAWFERMVSALELKEQEMQSRREKWRLREAAKREEECRFWANEHAWIKTRYVLVEDMLQKFMVKDLGGMDVETKKQSNEDINVENAQYHKHGGFEGKCPNIQHFDFVLNREHRAVGLHPNFDGLSSHANESTAAHDSESCFQHLMN